MFYALWIPCLSKVQPMIVAETVERTLRDVKDFEACRFRSTVDLNSFNVTLRYSLSDNEPLREIGFLCLHRTHSGIIVFRLDLNEGNDNVIESLKDGMHPSIYHIIKSHFHRHSFHDEECDTLLKPYCSAYEIKISNQSVMKEIYSFYLEQYCKKLQGALTDISAQYAHLKNLSKNDWFGFCLTEAKRIKETCDQSVGEAAYAKALLSMSRATVRTQIYEQLTSLTADLDRLSTKCTDSYTLINNRYNNRLGIMGLIVGLGGILLTVSLELIKCSTDDNQEFYHDEYLRLKQRADSMNFENNRVFNEFKQLKRN